MQRLPKEIEAHGEKRYSQFYSIIFDIPENWKIDPDHQTNNGNIEITLRHNTSYIEVNVINIEGHGIPQILTRKLLKDNWKECYNGSFPWSVNTNIGEYYIYYILYNNDFWTGRFSVGTGLEPIKPDYVEYPYYAIIVIRLTFCLNEPINPVTRITHFSHSNEL